MRAKLPVLCVCPVRSPRCGPGPGARARPHWGAAAQACRGGSRIFPVPECLFCAIVAGQIPATVVAETDRVLAFRDISPQAPTHVLVIPKDHYPDVAALAAAGDGLLDEVITQVQRVAAAEGVSESGYRVVFNTGADAGQAVPHVHAHLLGGRALSWPPG